MQIGLLSLRYGSNWHNGHRYECRCRLLDEENTPKRAKSGVQGWIDCFEKARLKGHYRLVVLVRGMTTRQDNYLISVRAPLTESIIKPRTSTSLADSHYLVHGVDYSNKKQPAE